MNLQSDCAPRARTYVVVSIFVILFFLAGTYATFLKAPRYIEIVTEKTRSDQVILSSGQSVIEHRTAERRSTYTSQTFEIENLGSRGSDARVSFVPSYLDTKVPVELTSFRKTTGDWEIDSHLMRYTSNKVGSSATWKGFGAGISLAISTNTPDVRLRIRWNGVSRVIHVRTPATGKVVNFPSRYSSLYLPLAGTESTMNVIQPSGSIYLRDGTSRLLLGRSGDMITIPTNRWPAKIVSFYGKVLLLASAFFITGLPLALLCAPLLRSIEAIPLAFFAGYSLLSLPTGSLEFLGVPAFAHSRTITLITLLVSIIFTLLLSIRSPDARRKVLGDVLSLESLLSISIAASATLFVFSPGIVKGDWFLGQVLTDTFYYSNWSSIYSQVRPYQHSGELLYSMRIVDLSATKVASDLLTSDTLRAQGPHAASLWWAFSLCAWVIVARLTSAPLLRVSGVALLSMSPTTYALFSESYTAQYIFVLLLASAVVGVGIFTRQGSDTRSSFVPNKADLAIGALVSPIFAMAAAIYPYHFVLPVACLMIATLLALCRKTTPLRRTVVVGLFSLLLVNIQLLIILRFGDADRFMTTLNDIARHVVFPYFSNFSVFEVAVGVRDHFQFGQAFGGEYFTALKGVVSSLDGVLCYAIAIVFIIGLTRSLISSDFFSATIGLQMVLMVSIAIVLYCTDQPYPFGKMVLSLGFPLVPLVIVGIDRLTLKNSMAMVSIMSLIMFYWLLRSCTSIIMMNVPPLTPPQLSVMRSVRTHVDELPDEIQHIRPLLTTLQGSPSKTVGIIGQPGSLKRTDGDRVIAFAIWHQLQGAVQRYFPEPPLGENAHLGSYQVITTRDVLDGHLRNGDFELLVVMNDELEILPLSRYKMNLKGERFSLLSRSSE